VQIKTEIEEDDSPLVDVSDLLQVEMKEDVIHNDGDSYNTKNSQHLEVDYSIKPSFKNRTVYNGKVQKVKLIPNKASVVAVEKFRIKKMRKVELERERRREMTELYDDLKENILACKNYDAMSMTNMPYHERMNAAIECIQDLEAEIQEQENTYNLLIAKNTELQHRMFELCDTAALDEPKMLYRCNVCHVQQSNIRASFLHHYFKEHKMEAESDTSSSYLKRKMQAPSKLSESKPTTNPLSVNQQFSKNRWVKLQNVSSSGSVYVPEDTSGRHMCLYCSVSFMDKTVLHIHSLLHKNLMYFQCPWPKCQLVFGLPSKLKTHHFLSHEIVLAAEEKCVLSPRSKVVLTRQIIELLSSKLNTSNQDEIVNVVDNFLEASLDATVVVDEMDIEAKIDKMLNEDSLDTLLSKINGMKYETV